MGAVQVLQHHGQRLINNTAGCARSHAAAHKQRCLLYICLNGLVRISIRYKQL